MIALVLMMLLCLVRTLLQPKSIPNPSALNSKVLLRAWSCGVAHRRAIQNAFFLGIMAFGGMAMQHLEFRGFFSVEKLEFPEDWQTLSGFGHTTVENEALKWV